MKSTWDATSTSCVCQPRHLAVSGGLCYLRGKEMPTQRCGVCRMSPNTAFHHTCEAGHSIVERAGPWCVAKGYTLMIITIEIAPDLEHQL